MESLSITLFCIVGAALIVLTGCVIYLIWAVWKLRNVVKALDPMSRYKKVGPSLYVKKPNKDSSSISSSFRHVERSVPTIFNNIEEQENNQNGNRNDAENLDQNFFTKTNYRLTDHQVQEDHRNALGGSKSKNFQQQRRNSEIEAMEAISKLDKVLF